MPIYRLGKRGSESGSDTIHLLMGPAASEPYQVPQPALRFRTFQRAPHPTPLTQRASRSTLAALASSCTRVVWDNVPISCIPTAGKEPLLAEGGHRPK